MEQAVKYITERFSRKLSRSRNYFTLTDLLDAGIPPFLAERIRIELQTNLAESVVPPSTDWADMDAPEVTRAWDLFLDAIHSEVRLPQSFAKGVMETCVAELVDVLSEPRKNLASVIFGNVSELDADEAVYRIRNVVVFRHLAQFLPRYLETKKLERISKDRYQRAMEQLDGKLSAKYSPLNWAQLLEPLFVLSNGEVEPVFIARFFKDKDMLVMASRFESLQDPIDSQRMIELLSIPVYTEDSPQTETRQEKQDDAKPSSQKEPEAAKEDDEAAEEPKKPQDPSQEKEKPYSAPSVMPAADSEAESAEGSEAEDNSGPDEDGEDEKPLYATFKSPDEDEEDERESDKYESPSVETKRKPLRAVPPEDEEVYDNIPLWQRLSASEDNSDVTGEESETPKEEKEAQERREPFEHPDTRKPHPDNLVEYLSDDQDKYVREIFKGDEEAYRDALNRMSEFPTWREAGKYLTNDVFKKNRIDMYKDITVDFTDRLHKFFKNRE